MTQRIPSLYEIGPVRKSCLFKFITVYVVLVLMVVATQSCGGLALVIFYPLQNDFSSVKSTAEVDSS